MGGCITGLWSVTITALNCSWEIRIPDSQQQWPIPWPRGTLHRILNWVYSPHDEPSPNRTTDLILELGAATIMFLVLILLGIKVVKPLPRLWLPFTFHLSQPEGDVSTVILEIVYCIAMGGLAIGISCFLDFLVQASDLSLVFLVPFQFCKIIISTYCFLSLGYLAYYAADEMQKMSL
jgi:hypothetical protein